MPIITPNYQIAAGNNNAGGLVRIDALSDANGVRFVMPRGVMNRNRGLRRFRLNNTAARVGKDSTFWISGGMTVMQYAYVLATYEGLVTVKLALTGVTFANYNATLWMPDEEELEYVRLVGASHDEGFVGPGYRNVRWNFIGLTAI